MPLYEFKPVQAGTLDELIQAVNTELLAVYQALAETDALDLRITHREPERPRDGMLVFPDGSDWNPGSGAGVYKYSSGWEKLVANSDLSNYTQDNVNETITGAWTFSNTVRLAANNGAVIFGDTGGTNQKLRFRPDTSGISYIQVGVSNVDATAHLRFTRYGTTLPMAHFEVEADLASFSTEVQIGGEVAYHRGNIVGTVSQSGGNPTGEILEEGSNANGNFIRYTSGVQECWLTGVTVVHEASNALGFTWTFPAAFVDGDYMVSLSVPDGGGSYTDINTRDVGATRVGSVSPTSCFVGVTRIAGATVNATAEIAGCRVSAIGRWF